MTCTDMWPSVATSGMRRIAVQASSPRTAVLSAASATAAPVSSQVATCGGSRVAMVRAPAVAHSGTTSGR